MDLSNTKQTTSRRVYWYIGGAVLAVASLYFLFGSSSTSAAPPVITKAIAVLQGDSQVGGTVTFTQSSPSGPVTITGSLKGLTPGKKQGFHIHVSGDLSNGCLSAGAHFNPFNKNHGAPGDSDRHVGDLGNIESDSIGVTTFTFEDKVISLNGAQSIVGRAVVLHAGTDDLGRGDDEESLKTGNAGPRAACGVIGIA